MNEAKIKEKLSRSFFEIICAAGGFTCCPQNDDFGVDVQVRRIGKLEREGHARHLATGELLDFQLKSTTANQVIDDPEHIRYDLESKTYNDMVCRKNDGVPMLLIVVVLPEDRPSWATVDIDQLVLKSRAYWYEIPNDATPIPNNNSSKRIYVPKSQVVDLNFLPAAFADNYS